MKLAYLCTLCNNRKSLSPVMCQLRHINCIFTDQFAAGKKDDIDKYELAIKSDMFIKQIETWRLVYTRACFAFYLFLRRMHYFTVPLTSAHCFLYRDFTDSDNKIYINLKMFISLGEAIPTFKALSHREYWNESPFTRAGNVSSGILSEEQIKIKVLFIEIPPKIIL